VRPPETNSSLLKELHGLLAGFDPEDPRDAELLHRLIERAGNAALSELSDRLIRPTTSRVLRRLIFQEVLRLPELEWAPVLTRGLLHEPDGALFEEGCRVLAQWGGEAATDALRTIARQRVEPEMALVLERKLDWLHSRMPFSYHFRDLLQGNQQPRLARAAADYLGRLAQPDNMEDLAFACCHPDPLAARLAHRILGVLPFPEAGRLLVESFTETHATLVADGRLRDLLDRIKKGGEGTPERLLEALRQGVDAEDAQAQEVLDELTQGVQAHREDLAPLFEQLRKAASNLDLRLVAIAELGLQNKKWSTAAAEFLQPMRQTQPRLAGMLDEGAEGLALHVRRGDLEGEEVLSLLEAAFRDEVGGEGLARAFASIMDPGDADRLALIHNCSVHGCRRVAMETLAAHGDVRLQSFLLKATDDPIVDNAQLAVTLLGRLPGAFDLGKDLLLSGRPDRIEKALLLFKANHILESGDLVLDFLKSTEREDLLLKALETLAELRHQSALEPLCGMLRGSHAPRVLVAIGETLARLGQPEGARVLLTRAAELRQPELLLQALVATVRIHGDSAQPLPEALVPQLEQVIQACWAEGDATRARVATLAAGVVVGDLSYYQRLGEQVAMVLAQQRKRPTLPRERFQDLVTVARDLERRLHVQDGQVKNDGKLRERVEAMRGRGSREPKALIALMAELDQEEMLGAGVKGCLASLVEAELSHPAGLGPAALALLCDLAARAGNSDLSPLIQAQLQRVNPGSSLARTLREALVALGSAAPTARSIRDILLLEPSLFFRKRIRSALLAAGWESREAQDRAEAEALLAERPTDLLVAEWADAQGPLEAWFRECWIAQRVGGVLLASADRSVESVLGEPWCHGILLKPFAPEALLAYLPRTE